MKFKVSRASDYNHSSEEKVKPIEIAKPEKIELIDVRIWTEEKFNEKFGKDSWRSEGSNHRILENDYIARDTGRFVDVFTIDVNTLEDIINLIKSEGDIVIGDDRSYKGIDGHITIYDDYLE